MEQRTQNARRMAILAIAVVAVMAPARAASAYVLDPTSPASPAVSAPTGTGAFNLAKATGGGGAVMSDPAIIVSATGGGSLTSPVRSFDGEPGAVATPSGGPSVAWIPITVLTGLLALSGLANLVRLNRRRRTPAV